MVSPGGAMHAVDVELVGLAASDVGVDGVVLVYSTRRIPLAAGSTPDEVARALCPAGVEVLHSTSWRHEPSGGVVLTYAAGPVPAEPGMIPLIEPSIVCSGEALVPSPADVHGHHVAAHAVRHLAYLVTRDPGVGEAVGSTRDERFWAAVDGAQEMPTGTHREAHARAHRAGHAGHPERSVLDIGESGSTG